MDFRATLGCSDLSTSTSFVIGLVFAFASHSEMAERS